MTKKTVKKVDAFAVLTDGNIKFFGDELRSTVFMGEITAMRYAEIERTETGRKMDVVPCTITYHVPKQSKLKK